MMTSKWRSAPWPLPRKPWTPAASSLQLQAIPEMDVLKAEGELATRQQDLTVARTNLELQELYMKNAITRSFDDPVLEEMPVVPTDHIGRPDRAGSPSPCRR